MKVALSLGALVAGLVVGTLGAFFQAVRVLVGGVTIPWGMVLALAALLLLIRGVIEAADTRWTGWALFFGWLATTVAFSAQLPSGGLVISAGSRQMAYLVGGVVLGAAAATVPPISRLRRA
ncbi:MAG: DUF6113 family protein [Candidatus Nanopelagicales bacterium]